MRGWDGRGAAASVAPHSLQNRDAGGGLAPQLGHVTASFAPHSLQNVDPAGGSWPQSPQVNVIPA